MNQSQQTWLPANALTSFQVLPTVEASLYVILLHLHLSLRLLYCPWWLQLKTCFSVTEESFLSICPVHFLFYSLLCTAICLSSTHLQISPYEIMLGQRILQFSKAPYYKCLQVPSDFLLIYQECWQDFLQADAHHLSANLPHFMINAG